MLVKKAIVLAAGKGTRMGPLGLKLAKPMWPFFGLTLLEIQIIFLKEQFGIEVIYLNSHHLHKQLEELNTGEVKVVYEPLLLDQGGGILNICKTFSLWNESLLINNADQLYFFEESLEKKINNSTMLFGLKVKKEDGYNKLNIDANGNLQNIIKNKEIEESDFFTYSGMALLKLDEQNYENTPMPFFDSVADFKSKEVRIVEIQKGEYYDFGKLDEYYSLCFSTKELLDQGKSNKLIELIKTSKNFKYDQSKGLNFSSDPSLKAKADEIIFDQGSIIKKDGIITSN